MPHYNNWIVNGCRTWARSCHQSLAFYAKDKKVAVEIGSWCGGSASIIAPVVDKLVCVDTFMTTAGFMEDTFVEFTQNMYRLGLVDKISTIRGDALLQETIDKLPGDIDFIYIDHGHSYEDIINLHKLIKPKLAPGAIVIFDDYSSSWPEVIVGVNEIIACGDLSAIEFIGGCIMVTKFENPPLEIKKEPVVI